MATLVSVAWFAADIVAVWQESGGADEGRFAVGGLYLLVISGCVGVATAFVSLVCVSIGALALRAGKVQGRHAVAAIPFGALSLFVARPLIADLLAGDWIAGQSWVEFGRVLLLLLSFVVPWELARRAIPVFSEMASGSASRRDRRRMTVMALASLATIPLLVYVDRTLMTRQYPAFHLGLAALFIATAALAGGNLSFRMPALSSRLLAGGFGLAAVAAPVLWMTGQLPGDDLYRRDFLLRRTQLTSKVLTLLLPEAELKSVSRDVLARLRAASGVDPAALDAALPDRRSWNLVLITVDTLRRDHLSLHGYRRDTPNIDRFAKESVVFDAAYTQFPSSVNGMTSMFTGLYPTATARYRYGRSHDAGLERYDDPPLAHRLSAAGYRTAATTSFPEFLIEVSAPHLKDGFSTFDNHPRKSGKNISRVIDQAIGELSNPGPSPLFLWVHVFNPHAPYFERPEFPYGRQAVERYDSEVAYADLQLGRLFDHLRESPVGKNTLVIFHSDHGEEFDDHGGSGHHSSLFEEQIRVPLLVHAPGIEPGSVTRPVGLVDLPATVSELFSLEPLAHEHGHSLVPFLVEGLVSADLLTFPAPIAFSQFRKPQYGYGDLDGVSDGKHKLIRNRRTGVLELYDLVVDPKEELNLALTGHPALPDLEAWLRACQDLAEEGSPPTVEVDVFDRLDQRHAAEDRLSAIRELARARRPDAVDAIAALLADSDPAVARLAMFSLVVIGGDAAVAELRKIAAAGRPRLARLGYLGLALCGFGPDATALERMFRESAGLDRYLTALALARTGSTEYRPMVLQHLVGPLLDRDLKTLSMIVMGRIGDPSVLRLFYFGMLSGYEYPEHSEAVVEALPGYEFEDAAPLARFMVSHPDLDVRSAALQYVKAHKRQEWVEVAKEAERDIQVCRGLSSVKGGVPIATTQHRIALERLRRIGVIDWGIALEHWYYLAVVGSRREAGRNLEAWLPESRDDPEFGRGIIQRLIRLARSSERIPKGKLEVFSPKDRWDRSRSRCLVAVRVTLEADGLGLVGGLGTLVEYLVTRPVAAGGAPIGSVAFNPLPIDGILPGESRLLLIPVDTGGFPDGSVGLVITVGRELKPIMNRITVSRTSIGKAK